MSNSKSHFSQYESPNIVIVPTVSCSTSSAKKIPPTTRDDDGSTNCNIQHIQTISESSRNIKYKTIVNTRSWASNYLQSIGQPLIQNIHKTPINTQINGSASTVDNLIHIDSKRSATPHLQHSVMNNNMGKEINNNNEIDKEESSLLSCIVPLNDKPSENKNAIKLNLLQHKYDIDSLGQDELLINTDLTSPRTKKRKFDTNNDGFHTLKAKEINKNHTVSSTELRTKKSPKKMLSSEKHKITEKLDTTETNTSKNYLPLSPSPRNNKNTLKTKKSPKKLLSSEIHKIKEKLDTTETNTSKNYLPLSSSPRNNKNTLKTCSQSTLKTNPKLNKDKQSKKSLKNPKLIESKKSLKNPKLIETRRKSKSKISTRNSKTTFTRQIPNKSVTQKIKTSTPVAQDNTQNKIKTALYIKSVVQITDNFDLTVCSDDLRHKLKRKYGQNEETRDSLIITIPNDEDDKDETSIKKSLIDNEYQVCKGETRINLTINFICEKPKDPQINLNVEEPKKESYPTPNDDISFLDDLDIDDIVECLNSGKENLKNTSKGEAHDNIRSENNDSLGENKKVQNIVFNKKSIVTMENDNKVNNIDISNIDVSEDYSQNKSKSDLNDVKDMKVVSEDIQATKNETGNKTNTANIKNEIITTTETQAELLNYPDLLNENGIKTDTPQNDETKYPRKEILASYISNSLDTKYVANNNLTTYISTQNIGCKSGILPFSSYDDTSSRKPCMVINDDKKANFLNDDKDSTYNNNSSIDIAMLEEIDTADNEKISKSDYMYSKGNIDVNTKTISNSDDCKEGGLNNSENSINVVAKDEMIQAKEPLREIDKITVRSIIKETTNDTIDSKTSKKMDLFNVNKIRQTSATPNAAIKILSKNKCLDNELNIKMENNVEKNIFVEIEQNKTNELSTAIQNKISQVKVYLPETDKKSVNSESVEIDKVLNKETKTIESDKNKNIEQSGGNTLKSNIVKLPNIDGKRDNRIEQGQELKIRENIQKDITATNKYPIAQSHNELVKQDLKIRMRDYLNINFDIGSLIHNGKYSRIFKCKDPKENSYVVKLLSNNKPGFQKERLLMRVQKDVPKENLNIIFTINSFGMRGQWCFLMEYYPKNLKDVLKKQQKPFHIDMVQRLSRQLVSAVIVLRNNNIVHSNIKPAHILLNDSLSELKLCGIDEMHYATNESLIPNIGTTNYRAPEVILGCPSSYSIDVWSTALVMYEMATCRKLFPGIYNNDILYKQMCTLGSIPLQMLATANFRESHFCGTRFMRRLGPGGKEIVLVDNFFGNNRISATLMETQKNILGHITLQARRQAVKKIKMFQKLLEAMLELNPVNRLPIEFVYADSFIFEKC